MQIMRRLYHEKWTFKQTVILLLLETALTIVVYLMVTRFSDLEPIHQPMDLIPFISHQNYDVNGTKIACDFPKLYAYSSTALWFYRKYPTIKCTEGLPTITHYDGETVWVNYSTMATLKMTVQPRCWYRSVLYKQKGRYETEKWQGPFSKTIQLKDSPEFVEVQCKDSNGDFVSKMHHYAVKKEQRAHGKPPKISLKKNQMNVLLIGIDSLSSQLYRRAMIKTREYMLETLGSIEMDMFHKVGDELLPNLLAMVSGESEISIWSGENGFDPIPFIWKHYKRAGYRTQYISDHHVFDNFRVKPTDSFNLPMVKALMKNKSRSRNVCFEDQVETKLWLDLILEFAHDAIFNTGHFFSFAMFERPTHRNANMASSVDDYYLRFLKDLLEFSILNNTFLAFFGGNGPTAGEYKKTPVGSFEEKSANMVIYVPLWFRLKYKEQYKNLVINAHRLTTNYDIYQTLRSILYLNEKEVTPRAAGKGVSLFSVISSDRTCKDAYIPYRFCMCYFGDEPVENSDLQLRIGNRVVQEINYKLFWYAHKCAALRLYKVQSLVVLEGNIQSSAVFKIVVTTVPGYGGFEATVMRSFPYWALPTIQVSPMIKRINAFRSQSECLEDVDELTRYCFCRDMMGQEFEPP